MNLKNFIKLLQPHILIIFLFVVLSCAFFYPIMMGKSLPQMDDTHTKGVSHELVQYEKAHPGEHPMWTNSIFGGMPSYLIKGVPSFNIYHRLQQLFRIGIPFTPIALLPYTTVAILFLLLLGFYLLMISLKADKYLSIAGAIGFAFATFNIMIIGVGHITQAYAISFIPMVAAGVLMLFNKSIFGGIAYSNFFRH